ncbi:hypothetical protein PoB_003154500 [Plakobranchus ocellatus]|uniref:Uncharacterized protein n=1 Tax=Plakobranchus ocellatus TaxID=259542 RepID=A0AAV4AE62_9GAST|nr:hypothetical protein PoB_003154500 [Plakobranchus ocellatus]
MLIIFRTCRSKGNEVVTGMEPLLHKLGGHKSPQCDSLVGIRGSMRLLLLLYHFQCPRTQPGGVLTWLIQDPINIRVRKNKLGGDNRPSTRFS